MISNVKKSLNIPKSVIVIRKIEEGHKTQWSKEKGQKDKKLKIE